MEYLSEKKKFIQFSLQIHVSTLRILLKRMSKKKTNRCAVNKYCKRVRSVLFKLVR